ncbi:YfhO family protein [Enterococcus termitis]
MRCRKAKLFYSWSSSMGLNFWALSAYYLNGLFTPLVILFDNSAMPDAIYFLTLLKFGASGLSFWVFSHNTYKINRWITVGLSVAYALSAYAIAYGVVVMWLDAFVYLPLIVLGIHRLMDKKKPVLLFVSYLLLFVSNFYMAFMIGLFTFLYVVARTFTDWKLYKKTFLSYLCTSFLAGGASMITILPTILDLKNNGEGLTTIRSFITPDVGAWDLIAKNLVGVYDTSKYESMPFIYIGLIPLIFCLFYFVSRKISLKNKLLYGSLFIILIASIYIYPLNLFWHGMHAPNMFLFRFSFLISFLVILLAGYGIELFEKEDANTLTNIFLATGGVFLLFLLLSNKKRYGVITTQSLVVTIALLVIYLLIWMGYVYRPNLKKWMPILLLIFMSGEALVNSKSILNEFKEDCIILQSTTLVKTTMLSIL